MTDKTASTLEADGVRQALEAGVSLYCRWYDRGQPPLGGVAMAYELVTAIRTALALLDAEVAPPDHTFALVSGDACGQDTLQQRSGRPAPDNRPVQIQIARQWLNRQRADKGEDCLDEGECRMCGAPAGEPHEATDPCGIITGLLAEFATAEASQAALVALVAHLTEYARHKPTCARRQPGYIQYESNPTMACDCGLADALHAPRTPKGGAVPQRSPIA